MYLLDTRTLAKKFRCDASTVRRWCRRLGFKRRGRDWWIDINMLADLKNVVRNKPGRPKNEK